MKPSSGARQFFTENRKPQTENRFYNLYLADPADRRRTRMICLTAVATVLLIGAVSLLLLLAG